MMARLPSQRPPIRGTILPGILCLISLILIVLVLVAGVNNRLTSIYYLKTDASQLSVPSKLSTSDFLKDLSTVSGADYVGQPQTAASLGIANTYTVHLLTACGHFSDGTVSCSKASLGFAFHPGSTLRLDSTSLQQSSSTYSEDLFSALSRYARLSRWLTGAYLASGIFLLLTLIVNCISPAAGAFTSFIATVVLFSASVGAAIVFANVNNAFNANFSQKVKLSSSLGSIPTALSFVACAFALVTAVLITLSARRAARSARRGPLARSVGAKDDSLLASGAVGPDPYAAPGTGTKGGGILAKVGNVIPGQRHKYVQVEAQPALVRTDVEGRQRGLDDEDWAAHDDYSRPGSRPGSPAAVGQGNKGAPDSVPLVSIGGNKQSRDMNSAYEPYSSHSAGH
ncbi:putative integral membrane protein [Rhypophila sp. PSN 637]